ncbi:cytochrome c-type biogenesis protein [Rhizobium halophilum]|uniref:cytochrome c-type biogenesis protein n=1 Tax=Rhizobium halophilum TaxID=2846852 RepID=UPI001EFDBC82|nr:cytochrome c-type biogenesis protein [Rhizobium halophilum]MCF6370490.1 cytochrome c-type biogenesis protein CcmH [Rhizobium halophilum]
MIRTLVLALMLILCPVLPAFAVNPDEILADPVLEERARDLSAQLRCMVCQNQSIDDSNAELARDLRVLVRERLVDGDSDEQVIDYVVSRYGEFVLLKPRMSARTLLLWVAPVLLLAAGAIILLLMARGRLQPVAPAPLTAEEQARLEDLVRPEPETRRQNITNNSSP